MSWKRNLLIKCPILVHPDKMEVFRLIYGRPNERLDADAADYLVVLLKHFHEGYFQLVF